MCNIFAADTSLFSKLLHINKPVTKLNTDLEKGKSISLSIQNAF